MTQICQQTGGAQHSMTQELGTNANTCTLSPGSYQPTTIASLFMGQD